MGTKKLDPAEKARRARQRAEMQEKARESARSAKLAAGLGKKGKKATAEPAGELLGRMASRFADPSGASDVAQSGTLADPIEARGSVVEDYEIVGELSPEERDTVTVFDAADPAFTGDAKVIGANVYKYDPAVFTYPKWDRMPGNPALRVLTVLDGEWPTWDDPCSFESGRWGEESHGVFLWHVEAIEEGDDAGPEEWRVRHHLPPDRARIGVPLSLEGLSEAYNVLVNVIDDAGDETPAAMYRGAPVAPEDAQLALDAATWDDPIEVTLYGRMAFVWTAPEVRRNDGSTDPAEPFEKWDTPPTAEEDGEPFGESPGWFTQMMDGTKGNGTPITSSLPDDMKKLRDNADGSIDAQQDDGSWKRIYTPTMPSNYGKNGEMFDDSLVRAPDRPPGYCPTITLGAPGLYAITRRALSKNADRIEKLASDTKREGFERQAREMIGDAKAIREDILPHFGGEQELPLAEFADVERAVAAAFSGVISVNASSREAAKLLEAMIADRVAKFVILVAERAFHAGEQAREFTAETFALRSVSRLFEADSKGGGDDA
jgi:hypothetical protein